MNGCNLCLRIPLLLLGKLNSSNSSLYLLFVKLRSYGDNQAALTQETRDHHGHKLWKLTISKMVAQSSDQTEDHQKKKKKNTKGTKATAEGASGWYL